MPPRGAKKRGSAKKTTPKPKQEEETLDAPIETPVEEKSIVEAETAVTNNDGGVIMKEEVSVTTSVTTTTTVVEESKVTEEVGGEKVSEVNCLSSVKVEESDVSEFVEEKRLESGGMSNAGDVPRLEGNAEAVDGEENEEPSEGEEDEEEMEEEDNEEAEDGEEMEEEENEESGSEEYDPEEGDDMQDDVEGEETAVVVSVGSGGVNANTGDNAGPDDEEDGTESDIGDDDEGDADLSSYMQLALPEDRKKQAGVEIFVGGLHRGAVEEDLIKVFGEFGEVKAVRIVKHPISKKSRGYAFVSYATAEQANKVLVELKDGIEVKGKRAGVSPSQDSDTLYMGNICKEWTKEKVLETLKGFGIEQIDEIYLSEDPKNEGKTRGFAYMEFSTHSDAMAAFQRLRKPDAVFGCDRSAKVSFAPSMHPNEEALSKVKTVFVEGLTNSWDEEKLKQLCEQYGPIEKIQLSRDLATVRRDDFGFVHFSSQENALACVEGISKAQIGEGDVKLKANLAKPKYKGLMGKNARGGYKVPKDGEKVVETEKPKAINGGVKSKGNKRKGKPPPQLKKARGGKQSRGSIGGHQGAIAASKVKEQPTKARKRDRRNKNSEPCERPSKKPRGNARGRPISGPGNFRKTSRSGRGRQGHYYDMAPTVYADPYVRGYTAPGSSHLGHASNAVSAMAPHAGYLTPAPTSHGRDPYDYNRRRAVEYDPQGSSAYVGRAYVAHGSPTGPYIGGSMHPPSYPPAYSSYPPEYERGSAGGYSYPSSGSYLYRRPYY